MSLFLISNEEFVIRNRGLRGCDGRACEATFATQDGFAFAALRGEDTYERGGAARRRLSQGLAGFETGADAPGCIPTLRGGEAGFGRDSGRRMHQGASLRSGCGFQGSDCGGEEQRELFLDFHQFLPCGIVKRLRACFEEGGETVIGGEDEGGVVIFYVVAGCDHGV